MNYKNLNFYKVSYELSLLIYKIEFPKIEVFSLQSQFRRCATSIPLNIAEGTGRKTEKDFKSFLYNALGSSRELEVLLCLALDLKYISLDTYTHLNNKLNLIISQLITYMKTINA